jgi:hypothetical protein
MSIFFNILLYHTTETCAKYFCYSIRTQCRCPYCFICPPPSPLPPRGNFALHSILIRSPVAVNSSTKLGSDCCTCCREYLSVLHTRARPSTRQSPSPAVPSMHASSAPGPHRNGKVLDTQWQVVLRSMKKNI